MDIEKVRFFWEENPLWTGESKFETGSIDFFEEHRSVYIDDCFAGQFDLRFLPPPRKNGQNLSILDLGCGAGFWTVEFAMRGLQNIVAADLTTRALEITKRRCKIYGVTAKVQQENAEQLSFADKTFDHVNCQGVVHHTPNPDKAVSEIARVLKTEGTASISVYYRNTILRLWPWLRWVGYPLSLLGGGLKGRGREGIFKVSDVDEIVRLYDGSDNPIGTSYTRETFMELLEPYFKIKGIYFHFFPARAMPFPIQSRLHRWLDTHLPFMIYASLEKLCVE